MKSQRSLLSMYVAAFALANRLCKRARALGLPLLGEENQCQVGEAWKPKNKNSSLQIFIFEGFLGRYGLERFKDNARLDVHLHTTDTGPDVLVEVTARITPTGTVWTKRGVFNREAKHGAMPQRDALLRILATFGETPYNAEALTEREARKMIDQMFRLAVAIKKTRVGVKTPVSLAEQSTAA